MPQFNKRGNRIRASDKSLVFRFSAGSLFLLFLAMVMLLNLKTILTIDWKAITLFQDGSVHFTVTPYMVVTVIVSVLVCATVALLYQRFQYDRVKQLFHRQKLARMILENGWYESETTQDSGFFKDLPATSKKEKITYFQSCTTVWKMACSISERKSRWENIKTSSYTWKRNWKQACIVSWCQKN